MHLLNCSIKQSGIFCPVLDVLSGLNFCYLHKGFPFKRSVRRKIKSIFSVLLTISEQESRRKTHENPVNYFILLIAEVFVFPSVSDKDSVLQNC